MSAPAMPAAQLACLLEDTAAGITADTAATGLIIGHDHFLHQPGFLDAGRLPCTGSQAAILRIAASLGDPAIGVHLRSVLGGLDHRNITLVTDAITAANGS